MKYIIIFLLLILCSCNSIWVVQGVEVKSPRCIQRKEMYAIGIGAMAGFVITDHFLKPGQKEKIRDTIKIK